MVIDLSQVSILEWIAIFLLWFWSPSFLAALVAYIFLAMRKGNARVAYVVFLLSSIFFFVGTGWLWLKKDLTLVLYIAFAILVEYLVFVKYGKTSETL